jgi:hypothetical protein
MTKEQQAEIARIMTGSNLSTDGIIGQVLCVSKAIKETVCPKVDEMVRKHNLPFDKAFSLVKAGFNNIAKEYNLDPAVLFWVYMDWMRDN